MSLAERIEITKAMDGFVREQLGLLKTVEASWQPSDFVPNSSQEDWFERVKEFRQKAAGIPDDVLVVLVGSMVTEEALPSYQTSFNRLEGVKDANGASDTGWAQWSRGWTAEENRHGDLLNRYLYLTGRVDMRSVEVTIQHLIRNGFDPKHDSDPYNGLIYAAFQERATRYSHAKIAHLTRGAGDSNLGGICGTIAGDEARHEEAYKIFVGKIVEVDPSGAVLALRLMMERMIVMPAHTMYDGQNKNLFAEFSIVAQRLGVYTFQDYIQILDQFLEQWKIAALTQLSSEAAAAQEYLCRLPAMLRRRTAFMEGRVKAGIPMGFLWINGRKV
ncbi:MAG: acyl-ACP desaturase [Planctomycetes bacterium]|nr:acyl-ACP desaturase [Planctomycetota bacterium]